MNCPCPKCGYCPTCGRSNFHPPQLRPWVFQPSIYPGTSGVPTTVTTTATIPINTSTGGVYQ
jgi:hypothetical protein